MASYGYTFNSGDGVTPTRLNAARTVSEIVNADIKSDAAIAGTKIAPDFGAQNVATTGSIATTGNIGAGTATPAEKLVVTGNASGSQIIAKVQNSATTASSQARVDLATGTANSFAIYSVTESGAGSSVCELSCGSGVSQGFFVTSGSTTAPIVFRQGGTERMRIASDGAVGLGTDAPTHRLHVDGAVRVTSEYRVGANHVVGARRTGWGAPTGTATRSGFDTAAVTLPNLAQRVKALIDDLTTHGLLGA